MNLDLVNEQKALIDLSRVLALELKKVRAERDEDFFWTNHRIEIEIDENFHEQETTLEKMREGAAKEEKKYEFYRKDLAIKEHHNRQKKRIIKTCEEKVEVILEPYNTRHKKLMAALKVEYENGGKDTYEACRKIRFEESQRLKKEHELALKKQKELERNNDGRSRE